MKVLKKYLGFELCNKQQTLEEKHSFSAYYWMEEITSCVEDPIKDEEI